MYGKCCIWALLPGAPIWTGLQPLACVATEPTILPPVWLFQVRDFLFQILIPIFLLNNSGPESTRLPFSSLQRESLRSPEGTYSVWEKGLTNITVSKQKLWVGHCRLVPGHKQQQRRAVGVRVGGMFVTVGKESCGPTDQCTASGSFWQRREVPKARVILEFRVCYHWDQCKHRNLWSRECDGHTQWWSGRDGWVWDSLRVLCARWWGGKFWFQANRFVSVSPELPGGVMNIANPMQIRMTGLPLECIDWWCPGHWCNTCDVNVGSLRMTVSRVIQASVIWVTGMCGLHDVGTLMWGFLLADGMDVGPGMWALWDSNIGLGASVRRVCVIGGGFHWVQ